AGQGVDDAFDLLLPGQESSLFPRALFQIEKGPETDGADETEPEEEVKRRARVPTSVDDGAAYKGPDEARSLADDVEDGEEEELVSDGGHAADENLRIAIPGTDEEAIQHLVKPQLPHVAEAETIGPVAGHAPAVDEDDGDADDAEHGLGPQVEPSLDVPEGGDADGLGGDAGQEQARDGDGVKGHDLVLKRRHHRHRRVEGVAQQEIAGQVDEALTQLHHVRRRVHQSPQAGDDDGLVLCDGDAGPALLEDEPRQREQEPGGGGAGDEGGQASIVGHLVFPAEAGHDGYDDGQHGHFAYRLPPEGEVADPAPLHLIATRHLILRQRPSTTFLERRRISGQAGQGSGPVRKRKLIGDESDGVEKDGDVPFAAAVVPLAVGNGQPAKADGIADQGPKGKEENPSDSRSEVGVGADDEQEHGLGAEGCAVGEEDDAVDVASSAAEVELLARGLAGCLFQQALEEGRREVEEGQAVGAGVVEVPCSELAVDEANNRGE
ncbi:hypothetical protein L249_0747, partial [Ophiocordyceps polyrhachis-furcata BCC 54312]